MRAPFPGGHPHRAHRQGSFLSFGAPTTRRRRSTLCAPTKNQQCSCLLLEKNLRQLALHSSQQCNARRTPTFRHETECKRANNPQVCPLWLPSAQGISSTRSRGGLSLLLLVLRSSWSAVIIMRSSCCRIPRFSSLRLFPFAPAAYMPCHQLTQPLKITFKVLTGRVKRIDLIGQGFCNRYFRFTKLLLLPWVQHNSVGCTRTWYQVSISIRFTHHRRVDSAHIRAGGTVQNSTYRQISYSSTMYRLSTSVYSICLVLRSPCLVSRVIVDLTALLRLRSV